MSNTTIENLLDAGHDPKNLYIVLSTALNSIEEFKGNEAEWLKDFLGVNMEEAKIHAVNQMEEEEDG